MTTNAIPKRAREWLEHAIKHSGMSQREFARRVGLSASAVSRILKDERQISLSEIYDAAVTLDRISDLPRIFSTDPDFIKALTNGSAAEVLLKELPEKQARDNELVEIRPFGPQFASIHIPWLVINSSSDDDFLRWFYITDASMGNAGSKDDVAVIDLADVNIHRSGIFAIQDSAGEPILRRLERKPFRHSSGDPIIISSDGALSPPIEADATDIHLLGRCVAIVKAYR